MPNHSDSFFEKHYPTSPQPPKVSFTLRQGDRLLLIGDSITEARRFSRMLETYLTVCLPELEIEVRNLGKGGETAEGFLARIDTECLNYQPTATTLCYGMNDSGYGYSTALEAAGKFRAASDLIVQKLLSAGSRVVLGSPGCMGQLPWWPFISELQCALDGLNTTLLGIRNETAEIASTNHLPFVDHFWNLYQARFTSAEKFGPAYAVCGADDGVHPSWAGHVVMASGFFTALGFDGNLGNFEIDLAAKTATADSGHTFKGELDGKYTFTSNRYPFCAEGLPDKDWSIRSGMTLVPFNQEFNRMILKVTGTSAASYRVSWMNYQNMFEEWHIYTAAELNAGINLADDFHINPFSVLFRRIDDLVFQKQTVESNKTWRVWESQGKSEADGLADNEAERAALLRAIQQAFVPVTHNIWLEAIS